MGDIGVCMQWRGGRESKAKGFGHWRPDNSDEQPDTRSSIVRVWSRLPPKTKSVSMVLLQLESVWMSLVWTATRDHMDI